MHMLINHHRPDDGGRHAVNEAHCESPAVSKGRTMTNTTPIILDRLEAALGAQGVKLKRQQLLVVAASAFGYRSDKTFSAAAAAGDLSAPPAPALGSDEHGLTVLHDPVADAHFAMNVEDRSARADRWTVTPYGNLVDISGVAGTPVNRAPVRLHMASISHRHGLNFYVDTTAGGLQAQIAEYCEEWWEEARQEDEDMPETTQGMTDDEIVNAYFCAMTDEYIDRSSDDVQLPQATAERLRTGGGHAWVAQRIDLEADEPLLWWSDTKGWGDLVDATVYAHRDMNLPDAGDASVSWEQLPTGYIEASLDDTMNSTHSRDAAGWDPVEDDLTSRMADTLAGTGIRVAEDVEFRVIRAEVCTAADAKDRRRLVMETSGRYDETSAREWSRNISPEIAAAEVVIDVGAERAQVIFRGDGDMAEAASPVDWVRAVTDLLTPAEGRERIMADFHPEAWVRDHAIEVDFNDPKEIDVTYEMLLIGREAAMEMGSGDTDHLLEAVRARPSVRNWSGPFTIIVHNAVEETNLFGDDIAE